MSETEPKIDFSTLAFPSDTLTVKRLRQRQPDAFDTDLAQGFTKIADQGRPYRRLAFQEALGLIDTERRLADRAFRVARGQPLEGTGLENREAMIESLAGEYDRYGLAAGPQHAAEMIRRFEAQAENQAQQHGSPRRYGSSRGR